MRYINTFYTFVFFVIFILTISVNTRGTIKSYTQFYKADKADSILSKNNLFNATLFIEKEPISIFLSYTGLETGFGFFAPNVASEYITEFKVYSEDSTLIKTSNFPHLKRKESITRIKSAYLMFEEYFNDDKDSLRLKKCNIFLKGLALRVLLDEEKGKYVHSKVYLYHHPLLGQLEDEPEMIPIYTLIKSQKYTKDNAWKHLK
ncbi:hypothetical protein [Aureibaculum luteum]|uniref:hypothetical protein n=1 Tax=Aureibaculum luteum TaxID=1548456 RepID=UPI000E4CD913|nr:hypothetical protein [Aureibaculum luteum]